MQPSRPVLPAPPGGGWGAFLPAPPTGTYLKDGREWGDMEIPDDDPVEAKRLIDRWVNEHLPSYALLRVRAQEEDHASRFLREYGRAVGQFEVEFSALVDVVDRLNFAQREAWLPHQHVQYVVLAHNLTPLRSVMDRVIKGYYGEALTLLRVAFETFIRLVFISVYRDDPWGSLVRKVPSSTPQFKLTGFVRDQLRLSWTTSYSVLSAFTHSNSVEVLDSLQRAGTREGDPERFGLSVTFDPNRIELVLPQLHFVVLVYLRFTIDRLVGRDLQRNVPEAATADEAIEVMTFVVRTHPKRYWQDVALDLDYVFELIAVADAGGEWRELAKSRPVIPAS